MAHAFKTTSDQSTSIGGAIDVVTHIGVPAEPSPTNYEEVRAFLRERAERLTRQEWEAGRQKGYAKMELTLKKRGKHTPANMEIATKAFDRGFNPKAEAAVRKALAQADVDTHSTRGPVTGAKWEGVTQLRDETPRSQGPLDQYLQRRAKEMGGNFPDIKSLLRECMIFGNRHLKCPVIGLFVLQLAMVGACFASPVLLSGPFTEGKPGWCYGIAWIGAALLMRFVAFLMVLGCGCLNFRVSNLHNFTNVFCCITSMFVLGNLSDNDFTTDDYICIGIAFAGSLATIHNWMCESVVVENRTVTVVSRSIWVWTSSTYGLSTTTTTITTWKSTIGVPYYLQNGCVDKVACTASIPCRHCGREVEAIFGVTQKIFCPRNNHETLPRPHPWKRRATEGPLGGCCEGFGCCDRREEECEKCGEVVEGNNTRVRHRFNCEKFSTTRHQKWLKNHLRCPLQAIGADVWQEYQRRQGQGQRQGQPPQPRGLPAPGQAASLREPMLAAAPPPPPATKVYGGAAGGGGGVKVVQAPAPAVATTYGQVATTKMQTVVVPPPAAVDTAGSQTFGKQELEGEDF